MAQRRLTARLCLSPRKAEPVEKLGAIARSASADLRSFMSFVVKSSAGAGLRSEPSASFPDPKTALNHARRLWVRGMRMITITDTESSETFDEAGLRRHVAQSEGRPASRHSE